MKSLIGKKKLITILLFCSLAINIICFLPYFEMYFEKVFSKIVPETYFSVGASDSVVIESVKKTSIKMDGLSFSYEQPKRGLLHDIYNFFKPSSTIQNNFPVGYLYAGLSEYANKYKDENVLNLLENKVNEFTDGDSLTYQLVEVDQVPIGICLLNLYKMTLNASYLKCANSIYQWLLNRRHNDINNIIYYRKGDKNQYVDALGMYIPFLVKYFEVTNDSLALKVAYDNMYEYYKYGVDKETGLPIHGYNIDNKIKVGSANWGRGIGWYVLAAGYLTDFKDNRLDCSLKLLSNTQFPNSSVSFDSSTALMLNFYLQKKELIPPSINFIKPYITDKGVIESCSGDTYGLNSYSMYFGPSELCHGLFFLLLSNSPIITNHNENRN